MRISTSVLYHRLTIQVPKKYQHHMRQLTILEATVAATTPTLLTVHAAKVCLVAATSKFKARVELHLCCQWVAVLKRGPNRVL